MRSHLPISFVPEPAPDMEGGLTLGRVLQLRVQAWLTGHAAAATVTILAARHQVALAGTASEEAEAELFLRRRLRSSDPSESRTLLGQETETERLLLEREQLRRERLRPGGGATAGEARALPAAAEWAISDQQIEAMAVRAVAHFAQFSGAKAERARALWRTELQQRLPPYAALEVAHRVEALLGLTR
jgi:hypothetical protein